MIFELNSVQLEFLASLSPGETVVQYIPNHLAGDRWKAHYADVLYLLEAGLMQDVTRRAPAHILARMYAEMPREADDFAIYRLSEKAVQIIYTTGSTLVN